MFVGVSRLTLDVVGSRSLKDKRRVVLSLKERLQARLHVSAAEVGALDDLRRAVVGVAVVSNDAATCDEVLASAAHLAGTLRDAVLADVATELVPLGAEGRGLRGGLGADLRTLAEVEAEEAS